MKIEKLVEGIVVYKLITHENGAIEKIYEDLDWDNMTPEQIELHKPKDITEDITEEVKK